MAKNYLLPPKAAQDIDQRVERVLRGLGNPEPPLRLEDVRELLKLDRAFYTAHDPGIAREAISRIRVSAIQVFHRPTLIIDAVRKFSLKALYLPDRKRILLDGDEPIKKHRWNEAHEIGHSLIPWHDGVMLGDNAHTVSRDCREQIEAEANYAAGRLLFFRERFAIEAGSLELSIASVQHLHGAFGNTISTTFYRFIEVAGVERPVVGLITCHPHPSRRPADHDPARPCRHFIQSPAFAARFGRMPEADVFRAVASYCGAQSGGPLGTAELVLTDDNGDRHRFVFETFFNRYDALTLGVYVRPKMRAVSIST
ncbi:ImmA/IrrE family metallo-endopeptidase [Leptospira interrogans]